MLASSTKGYNEAIAATYKLLCNLLASKPQTQWDCIIQEKHEHDLWAGADGKKHALGISRPREYQAHDLERYSKKQPSKDEDSTTHPEKGKPNKGMLKGGSTD